MVSLNLAHPVYTVIIIAAARCYRSAQYLLRQIVHQSVSSLPIRLCDVEVRGHIQCMLEYFENNCMAD